MKILIAEQDRDFSSAFSILFGMDSDTVTVVYDGTQVISRLENGQDFDIAVVDESLPRINAKKLLEPLSARNIPVIVLTSEKLTASKLTASPLANEYISLPFLPAELAGLIKSVSDKKKSKEKLEFEDINISVPDFKLCGSIQRHPCHEN